MAASHSVALKNIFSYQKVIFPSLSVSRAKRANACHKRLFHCDHQCHLVEPDGGLFDN